MRIIMYNIAAASPGLMLGFFHKNDPARHGTLHTQHERFADHRALYNSSGDSPATLVNNARIGDVNVRIGDVKEVLRAEMDARFAKLDVSLELRFSSIDRKLDELLRVVASHNHRIRELEERGR
jgi:hypothetical protein